MGFSSHHASIEQICASVDFLWLGSALGSVILFNHLFSMVLNNPADLARLKEKILAGVLFKEVSCLSLLVKGQLDSLALEFCLGEKVRF